MTERLQNNASHPNGNSETIYIRIAGITVALTCDDPATRFRVEETTEKFVVEEAVADVRVRASLGEIRAETGGEKLFDSGALWKLYREEGDYLFRFCSPYYGSLPYKEASFNPGFTEGEIRMHRPFFDTARALYPMEYPLDELLMLNQLALGKGVEVHSSGVIDSSGKAFLFVGQSGAGKTTMTRLWQKHGGVKILSDDRIILRKVDNSMWMYGTPWHGEAEISCATQAPLSHIFFLRHGQKNELVSTTRAAAAVRLFACGFPPFHSPSGLEFTLSFYDELTRSVPCSEVIFLPDDGVIDFIRHNAA
jgi:hypothetical protein